MKLNELGGPTVAEDIIRRYLLNPSHPAGRSKAAFFMRFGFTQANWRQLRQALIDHVNDNEVTIIDENPFGKRYSIDGPLKTPDGRSPRIRSVWVTEPGQPNPRLITAHPI